MECLMTALDLRHSTKLTIKVKMDSGRYACVVMMAVPFNFTYLPLFNCHCGDVIMGAMASQITSLAIGYSTVYSGRDQRKHQSSASLVFMWGIHRWPVNSPPEGQSRGKCFHLMTSLCAKLCFITLSHSYRQLQHHNTYRHWNCG